MPAARVHDELAALPGPDLREPGDERFERVVGNRQQHELRPLDDVGHLEHRHGGQQQLRALTARRRDRRDADHGMARGPQGVAEHGPDPARADHAHAEAPGAGSAGSPGRVAGGGARPVTALARAVHESRG